MNATDSQAPSGERFNNPWKVFDEQNLLGEKKNQLSNPLRTIYADPAFSKKRNTRPVRSFNVTVLKHPLTPNRSNISKAQNTESVTEHVNSISRINYDSVKVNHKHSRKTNYTNDHLAETSDDEIKTAIYNENWKFFTVESIVEETGFEKETVTEFLANSPIVRLAMIADKQGRRLYTLKKNRAGLKEWAAFIQSCITKNF